MNGFTRSSETYDEGLACLAAALWRLGQQDTARSVMQRFMLAKREKMTDYPGTDPARWRSCLLRVLPITDQAILDRLFDDFRKAGLPV